MFSCYCCFNSRGDTGCPPFLVSLTPSPCLPLLSSLLPLPPPHNSSSLFAPHPHRETVCDVACNSLHPGGVRPRSGHLHRVLCRLHLRVLEQEEE